MTFGPYYVRIGSFDARFDTEQLLEMEHWCIKNCAGVGKIFVRNAYGYLNTFKFDLEEDAMAFKLR